MRTPLIAATGFALGIAATLALLPATAQHAGHTGHTMPASDTMHPATQAFMAINDQMHTAMAIEFTGDPDSDFVRAMIPHHQGAVDMARVVLEHGTDPEIRALAEAIVAAQETEIAFMHDWLSRR